MDFTKFRSMLDAHALFFSRADLFEDQFEGSYPRPNVDSRLERQSEGLIRFIAFDPMKKTNNIIGRYKVRDSGQLRNYPIRLEVGKDITEEEFEDLPEIYRDVDVQTRKLIPVSPEEVQRRGGTPRSREDAAQDDVEFYQEAARYQSQFFESLRSHTFVNCWHASEDESAGMWRLYGNQEGSISVQSTFASSVQSTFARLRAVLPNRLDDFGRPLNGHIDIALVQYRDYSADQIPEGYMFDGFLYKRRFFEHERELRAFFQDIPFTQGRGPFPPPQEVGRQVPVNLNGLIEAIFVSPMAPPIFYDRVQDVCTPYKLHNLVHRSSLAQRPSF
jgi:hypothetical protein